MQELESRIGNVVKPQSGSEVINALVTNWMSVVTLNVLQGVLLSLMG